MAARRIAPPLLAALLCSFLAGIAVAEETLLVSAASSLEGAMWEAAARFEATHVGAAAAVNAAASGVLMRQIEQGAPVDLFVSASREEIERLEQAGRIEKGIARPLASNRLVIVVPPGNRPPDRLDDLRDPRFDRIAIGNPRTVPAGRYAEQALRSAGIRDAVASRLILGESVRQVIQYVARGDVAAGIVYATDAMALADRIATGPDLPVRLHDPIVYLAAPLRDAPHPVAAAEMMAFLLSGEGRALLARRGFLPPPPP
jgi:molybdate transport system substrate-binding protein